MKNRKSNHLNLRKRGLVILILVFSLVGFMSCDRDDFSESSAAQEKVGIGTNPFTTIQIIRDCNKIEFMKFPNINSLYNKHLELYTAYMAGEQDEQVLVNFENTHNFFSLRKKDNMIDDGLLFDDVNFDPFDYTTDAILESFLNEKGQFIIGNDVYIVDDLCVWYKAPFSCESAAALIRLRDLMKQIEHSGVNASINQEIFEIMDDYSVEQVDSCSDPIYDFESISENGGRLPDNIPNINAKIGSGCGHQAFIEHEVISYDTATEIARYRLTANHLSIASSGLAIFDMFRFTNDAENVTIVDGSGYPLPGHTFSGNKGNYVGQWVEFEVDFSTINTLEVKLISTIGFGEGFGCMSIDKITLDLTCPISISYKPITAEEWEFKITGIDAAVYQNFNNGVIWNFGDGNMTANTGLSTVHTYTLPCDEINVLVSAIRGEGLPCGPNALSIDAPGVNLVDNCKFSSGTSKGPGPALKIAGKKVRSKIKHKKNFITGTTKIKYVLRYRKDGVSKEISSNGLIYKATGTTCVPTSIATKIPPQSKTGKKPLRVKFKEAGVHYKYDANNPYQVTFSTSNGYLETFGLEKPCMSPM